MRLSLVACVALAATVISPAAGSSVLSGKCQRCLTIASVAPSASVGACASKCVRASHAVGFTSTLLGRGVAEDCEIECKRVSYVSRFLAAYEPETVRSQGAYRSISPGAKSLGNSYAGAETTCQAIGHCQDVVPETPLVTDPAHTAARDGGVLPVVLMHGIASEADAMAELAEWIRQRYPGIYVKNLEVRTLLVNGFFSSIFMSLNEQVENVCSQLERDRNLESGFDLIGFSQGTQVTRGYLERCNSPRVRNWISLAGVNGGLFGEGMIPSVVDKALHKVPFDDWVQRTFTWAQMWKDPFDLPRYLNASEFMADVNNDRAVKNPAYRDNFLRLDHAVLFYSPNDDVIRPQASGWFEFFAAGQDKNVVPLASTDGYEGDWLGLKSLHDTGKLVQFRSGCLHVEHVGQECKEFVEEKIMPFLGNGGNATAAARVVSRRH